MNLLQELPNMSAAETCQSFQRIASKPVFHESEPQVSLLDNPAPFRALVPADRALCSKLVSLVLSAKLPSGRQFRGGNLTSSLSFLFSLRLSGLTVSFSTLRT